MKSLRWRLLLAGLCWIFLSLAAAGWGLEQLFKRHVSEQLYSELRLYLDRLTSQIESEQGQIQLHNAPNDARFNKPFSGLYWQIIAPKTGQVLRSRSLWDQQLPAPEQRLRGLTRIQLTLPQEGLLLALARPVRLERQSLVILVAADQHFLNKPLARFQQELWRSLLVLGAGLLIAIFLQLYLGLAPLRKLQHALKNVRQGKTQQLDGQFPQEVMPLVNELNSVLKHNAEIVDRARTQAGNLAHALKTPLTILANAAYAEPDNPLAKQITAQLNSARKHIDYHLKRAQAAANAQTHHSHCALLPVIQGLARVFDRLYAEQHKTLKLLPFSEDLRFRGDEQDLQEMLGNLLDNAFKWAASTITIGAAIEGNQLIISIEDDGSGIDDSQKQRVLQRGIRADEQTPGSGLGLSIVSDLAHLYHGKLELLDSDKGGVKALLSLPAALGNF